MGTANAALWPVDDLGRFLAGDWAMERSVLGEVPFAASHLLGVAHFAVNDSGLHYAEQGWMSFGRSAVSAERSLLFARHSSGAPGRAVIRFGNGLPFHSLDLSTGHDCVVYVRQGDVYRGYYRVLDPQNWCVAWRITGQHKDFTTVTRYHRLA